MSWIWDARQPNQAIEIWLDRNGHRKERLFDPYTGVDLGESRPYSIQLLAWLADLHVNLLAGKTGRLVNGAGAIFVIIISITGAVLWWPGIPTWRRALTIQPSSNWKLFNWQLHSVIGLWMLPFVFLFGVVGTYAGFPDRFKSSLTRSLHWSCMATRTCRDSFRPNPSTGDKIIRWFSYLHFGNFAGWPSKALWMVVGLAPAFLFVTGVLMWWNRVLSPAARRLRRASIRITSGGI